MMKRTLFSVALASCFVTGAIAAESAPSNVVGFIRYDLSKSGSNGMNMVAIPFDQTKNATPVNTVSNVETAVGANFTQALKLNNSTKVFAAYVAGSAGSPSDYALVQGDPLTVLMNGTGSFVSAGGVNASTSPVSYSLSKSGTNGMNMAAVIPYNDVTNGSVFDHISDIETVVGANFTQALKLNNSTKVFAAYVAGSAGSPSDYALALGDPMTILMNGTGTLTAPVISNGNGNNVFSAAKSSSASTTSVKKNSVKEIKTVKKTVNKSN